MPASTPRKPGAEPLVEESRTAPVAALAAGEAIAMLQAARDLIVQLALMAAQDDRGGATVTVYVESSRNSATRGRTRCLRKRTPPRIRKASIEPVTAWIADFP